jgi:hypothetical protein
MSDIKHGTENAKAIKNCLEYLAKEARLTGLEELAELIDVAALAAQEIAGSVPYKILGGTTRMVPPSRAANTSSAAPRNRLRRR